MSKLTWTQTTNTDELSVWQSDAWRAVGTGYLYGNGIRRRWELFEDNVSHGAMSRLSEAKSFAAKTEILRAKPETSQHVALSDDAMRQMFRTGQQ